MPLLGAPCTYSATPTEPVFYAANTSLRALEATLGNSYKCNAEQHVRVTEAFSLNVFRVWLQAFHIEGGKFGSGELEFGGGLCAGLIPHGSSPACGVGPGRGRPSPTLLQWRSACWMRTAC